MLIFKIIAHILVSGEAFMENRKQDANINPAVPKLQKSRTGFYLNMYTPSPSTQISSSSYPQQAQGILKPSQVQSVQQMKKQIQQPTSVKRSRSFGSASINQTQRTAPPIHSVYSDFQISRWPKRIQETVTAAVTGNFFYLIGTCKTLDIKSQCSDYELCKLDH